MICSAPSTPCSCVPGARCCQRYRNRMKSRASPARSRGAAGRASAGECARARGDCTIRSRCRGRGRRREAAAQNLPFGFEPEPARPPSRPAGSANRARGRSAFAGRSIRAIRAGSRRRRLADRHVGGAIVVARSREQSRRPDRASAPTSAARPQPRSSRRPTLRTVARRRLAQRPRRKRSHSANRRHDDQREQRIVQLVGVAHDRPRLGGDLGDRRRVERADTAGIGPAACAASARRARAALRAARRRDRRTDSR